MNKTSNRWFTVSGWALAMTIVAAAYLIGRFEFLKQSGIDSAQGMPNWSWHNSADFHRDLLQHWLWRGLALSLALSLCGWAHQLFFRSHAETSRRSLLVGAITTVLSASLLATVLYIFAMTMR